MKKVTNSKTYQLYSQLLNDGFNVELTSMFSYAYDKDNKYLTIIVREAEQRLEELCDKTGEFDVLLVRHANTKDICFEVRKAHDFAEFVNDAEWREYYNSIATA
jgi:hypothetical protein